MPGDPKSVPLVACPIYELNQRRVVIKETATLITSICLAWRAVKVGGGQMTMTIRPPKNGEHAGCQIFVEFLFVLCFLFGIQNALWTLGSVFLGSFLTAFYENQTSHTFTFHSALVYDGFRWRYFPVTEKRYENAFSYMTMNKSTRKQRSLIQLDWTAWKMRLMQTKAPKRKLSPHYTDAIQLLHSPSLVEKLSFLIVIEWLTWVLTVYIN